MLFSRTAGAWVLKSCDLWRWQLFLLRPPLLTLPKAHQPKDFQFLYNASIMYKPLIKVAQNSFQHLDLDGSLFATCT